MAKQTDIQPPVIPQVSNEDRVGVPVSAQMQQVMLPAVLASSAATETDVQTASSNPSGVSVGLDQLSELIQGLIQRELNRLQIPTVTHTSTIPPISQAQMSTPVVLSMTPTFTPTPTTPSLRASEFTTITSHSGSYTRATTKLPMIAELPTFSGEIQGVGGDISAEVFLKAIERETCRPTWTDNQYINFSQETFIWSG